MEISQQKLDEFQSRLSNWVASQGLMFQLTHGGGVRGAHSSIASWLVRTLLRLLFLALLAGVVFWIYLAKRVDFNAFREELHDDMVAALEAETATLGVVKRKGGYLELSLLEMEGSDESFFDNLTVRGLKTKMGVLDGAVTKWNGEALLIEELNVELKAGAEDNEQGSRIYNRLFEQGENFTFARLELSDATISWGYSGVTKGSIEKAQVRGARSDDGWQFLIVGGTFHQNWLKDLKIERMEVFVGADGIEIKKAYMKHESGLGELGFNCKVEGPASHPKLTGKGGMKNLPFDSFLAPEVAKFMGGSVSGDFTIGGSPYASGGVNLKANIILEGDDRVELRDRLPLFKAISVVDRFHSYKNVRFTVGSFTMETGGAVAVLSDIDLEATDIMNLEGEFLVRRQSEEEIDEALRLERGGGILNIEENPEEPTTEESEELSLADAARLARQSKGSAEEELKDILLSQADLMAKQRLFDEARDRQKRAPRLEGLIRMGLNAKSFERAPQLVNLYPIDNKTGLRWVDVPLDGNLYEAGVLRAEEIYNRSGSGDLGHPKEEGTPEPSKAPVTETEEAVVQ